MSSNSWNRFQKKPEMCSEDSGEKVYKVKKSQAYINCFERIMIDVGKNN